MAGDPTAMKFPHFDQKSRDEAVRDKAPYIFQDLYPHKCHVV
jgi:hypothetical protein